MNTTPLSDLHASARQYAAEGWAVFPCFSKSKLPATRDGFKSAATNIAQIDRWWRTNPHYNIGFCPGSADIIVVDVDVKKGAPGMRTARQLGLFDSPTRTADTPSGGVHLFYRRPAHLKHVGNSRALGPGLDVRADAGYALLAPSVLTEGGRYAWRASSVIAPLPERIVALLAEPERPAVVYRTVWSDDASKIRRGRAYIANVPQALPGTRNETAFRVAAWLTHDLELAEGDARALLHELNAGWPTPLSVHELEATLKSGIKNGKHSFGSADDLLITAGRRPFAKTTNISGWGDL